MKEHKEGKVISTKDRCPLKIVYCEAGLDQNDATLREKYLKSSWGKRYIKNRLGNYLTGLIFPATQISTDPRTGIQRRHHLDETVLQKAIKEAIRKAGIAKHAGCHTFRHSFATHLLESGF